MGIDAKTSGILKRIQGVGKYFYNRKAANKLEKLIVETKPDIAHAHLFWGGISGSIFRVLKKYNIPIAMSSDILSQRKDISEYNEFVLYAITDIIQHDKIKEYFAPQEIKLYSNKKYDPPKTSFPLKLHLIKIS